MRIGILTFHRAINYGAVLQCYGLYMALKEKGNDVEIIDYRPDSVDYYRYPISIFKLRHTKGLINKFRVAIASLLNFFNIIDANKRFDSFLHKNFKFSNTVLNSNQVPDYYDIIYFGSDQIWSPQICYGFDPVYWGQFKHERSVLVTYAASMGGHNHLNKSEWSLIGEYLKSFKFLSVREPQLQNELLMHLNIASQLVVDPTLLLDIESYESMVVRPKDIPNNYVLVFSVAPTDNLIGFAEKVASHNNSDIIVLSACALRRCRYRNVTPGVNEFLGWFKYASCIVTVSFHGTVFSVLFKRDFYSLSNYMQDRAESFLRFLGLEDRLVSSDEKTIQSLDYSHVDYSGVGEKLREMKEDSMRYINNCSSVKRKSF